ncbi:MAG TPA: pentapeptide repeat-containing protein [Streptosporangiaceae bacterium]|nr:pentapeptide repeat-containing protein [Streptosporangiaceae bacterium]
MVASKPTDAVTYGFWPAAARLGLDVTVLTDQPDAHRAALAAAAHSPAAQSPAAQSPAGPVRVVGCDVWDHRALIRGVTDLPGTDAIFSNSDHLQAQTALAAHYFGLPGKDWRASQRAKDKLLMRRHLARAGVEHVPAVEITGDACPGDLRFPVVLKPAEGVASEEVVLVGTPAELAARTAEALRRDPGRRLIAEEYLPGTLRTLETLGDGHTLWVLGGFRTSLSPLPFFAEERLTWDPPSGAEQAHVTGALASLGVAFGAAHTEFAAGDASGPRLIEVNDRLIGDHCEFLLADLLGPDLVGTDLSGTDLSGTDLSGTDLFGQVLRVHLGDRLPTVAPRPRYRFAIADSVFADRPGVLASVPEPVAGAAEPGVRLTCWPLRRAGETIALTHSNRDYLGVITACGDDQDAVARSVAAARAAWHWEIRPGQSQHREIRP